MNAPVMQVTVPLKTGRGQNDRGHWADKHRRASKEHSTVQWYLHLMLKKPPKPPLNVRITRMAPSVGLDDDNLVGSLKGVRDGIAEWLCVDDGNKVVRYHCEQETAKEWAVRIEFFKVDT